MFLARMLINLTHAPCNCVYLHLDFLMPKIVADPEIFRNMRRGRRKTISALSAFIASAHNELYTRFILEKATR